MSFGTCEATSGACLRESSYTQIGIFKTGNDVHAIQYEFRNQTTEYQLPVFEFSRLSYEC